MAETDAADSAAWRDRVRGCLLGGALGDALGAPFEGWASVPVEALDRHLRATSQLTWTDDTALQLATAQHLAELESWDGFDDDAYARDIAEAWQRDPERGYGPNPPLLFGAVLAGDDWRSAAAESFGGEGSLGNGGAMRAAPFGVLPVDVATVATLARRMAAVTHAHPVGKDGAALIAVAAHHLLGAGTAAADGADAADGLVACCVGHLDTTALREAVAAVPPTLDVDEPRAVAEMTGAGVAAHESAPAALAAFLHRPLDPIAAISFAVLMGGDADTVAAMTGSLGGAAAGASALPASLLDRLEDRAEIERVADRLAERTTPS